ncbi:MAG: hypothetical protein RR382_04915 [Tannerellaceae bacterium]
MPVEGTLSFRKFNKWFAKLPDRQRVVAECALFLYQEEIQQKELWRKFTVQFMKHYHIELLAYFGLAEQMSGVPRVRVENSSLFVAVMYSMYHTGLFGGKEKELAEALCTVFDLPIRPSTVVQYLSGYQTEYEGIRAFFEQYKQYDFSIK